MTAFYFFCLQVKLWDRRRCGSNSGDVPSCLQVLEGHTDAVVSLQLDNRKIASGAYNEKFCCGMPLVVSNCMH